MKPRSKAPCRLSILTAIMAFAFVSGGCSDDGRQPIDQAPVAQAAGPHESFENVKKRFESRFQSGILPWDSTATSTVNIDEVTYRITQTDDPLEPYTAEMTLRTTIQYTQIHLPTGEELAEADAANRSANNGPAADGAALDDPAVIGRPPIDSAAVRGRGDPEADESPADRNAALFDPDPIEQVLKDVRHTTDVFDFGYRDNRWYLKTNEANWPSAKLAIQWALEDQ